MSPAPVASFTKATKTQARARVAFAGPTGSGKTWTALEWAEVLAARAGGRIAFVDTEHGSASLYADRFDFDVMEWRGDYDPRELAKVIRSTVDQGYAVLIIDSLSHFWEGEGGTRDIVDSAAERAHGNTFAGWKVGTPALRTLVDTMLAADLHVLATMRAKMEWVLETNERGKQVPRKIGMAPVMRAGIEYEFTLVADIDLEHRVVITKSRCTELADKVLQPGLAARGAEQFVEWLTAGAPDPIAERRKRFAELPAEARDKILGWLASADVGSIDEAPRELWEKLDGIIDRAAKAAAEGDTPPADPAQVDDIDEGGEYRQGGKALPDDPEFDVDGDGQGDDLPYRPEPGDSGHDGEPTSIADPAEQAAYEADEDAVGRDELRALMAAAGVTDAQALRTARAIAKQMGLEQPTRFEGIGGPLLIAVAAEIGGPNDDGPGGGAPPDGPRGSGPDDPGADTPQGAAPADANPSADRVGLDTAEAGATAPANATRPGHTPTGELTKRAYFAKASKLAPALGIDGDELRARLVSIVTKGEHTSASAAEFGPYEWGSMCQLAERINDGAELVQVGDRWQVVDPEHGAGAA